MKALWRHALGITLLISFIAPPASATTVDELDERLYQLEKAVGGKSPVVPMDAKKMRLGGFLTSTYTILNNDKKSESAFQSNRFELLLGMDITNNLEFFTAFGIISRTNLSAGSSGDVHEIDRTFDNGTRQHAVPLIISHGTYKWKSWANLKFGRFVAPVGIINVEHFPPGLLLETLPTHLRPDPGGINWNHFLNGLDFYGVLPFDGHSLQYHVNYSTFSFAGANSTVIGEPTRPFLGTRLAWTFWKDRLTLGHSWQGGNRQSESTSTDSFGGEARAFDNHGFDFLVNWGGFIMKTEYNKFFNEREANFDSLMIQPSYEVYKNIRLVYRYDKFQNSNVNGGTIAAGTSVAANRTENIFGVNWLPNPLLRLRAEYKAVGYEDETSTVDSTQKRDYNEILLSAVLSF